MNDYEKARDRLELAERAVQQIKAVKAALTAAETIIEAEWAAATRNLREHETKPGIPLPQYREPLLDDSHGD